MILLFYYEESKNTLTPRFENPMAIFKLVVIGVPIGVSFQIECRKGRLLRATGYYDRMTV